MDNCELKIESKSLDLILDLALTKILDVKLSLRPLSKIEPTEEESIIKLSTLARFTINQASRDPSDILSTIQILISRLSIAGSSEPRQTISSLITVFSNASTPFVISSPYSSILSLSLSFNLLF